MARWLGLWAAVIPAAHAADLDADGCEDSFYAANQACVHPTATVAPGAVIGARAAVGPYVVVAAGAVIAPRAVLAGRDVGVGTLPVGTGTTIGRRTVVGANGSFGSSDFVAADVAIGRELDAGDAAWIGYGAVVGDHVTLDDQSTVGSLVQLGDYSRLGPSASIGRAATVADAPRARDGAVIEGDVGPDVQIGVGAFVGAGARVNRGATLGAGAEVLAGARVGRNVDVGAGARVGVGAVVRSGATVAPCGDIDGGAHVPRGDTWSDGDACPDHEPDPFTVPALTNQARGAVVQSTPLSLTGFEGPMFVEVVGDGTPELRVAGGPWATEGDLAPGQSLDLRVTTSPDYATTRSVTLNAGTTAATWTVGTVPDHDPDAFTVPDATGANPSSSVTSTPVSITGFAAGLPLSVSGDGSPQISVEGGPFAASGTLSPGQSFVIRATSAATYDTPRAITVTAGSATSTWTLRTKIDQLPDTFSFAATSDQNLSALVTSGALTLTGYAGPIAVSVAGSGSPQLSVAGGAWASSGTLNPGQSIQLRATSSASYGTLQTLTLTAGDGSGTWALTTKAQCPSTCSVSGTNRCVCAGTGPAACPAGAEWDCGVYSGWTAGTAQRCIIPSGWSLVSGTIQAYRHGATPGGGTGTCSYTLTGNQSFNFTLQRN